MEAILELLIAIIVQPILWAIPFVAFVLGSVIEIASTTVSKGKTDAKSSVCRKVKELAGGAKERGTPSSPRKFTSLNALVRFDWFRSRHRQLLELRNEDNLPKQIDLK